MQETRSDATALRHPLWWSALAVLVVNDHALKGAGIVPDWVTGKLSDFAGLIVAPVLLSAMLRARGPRARGLAFVAVGGWFAAVKLVPAAAYASVALAAALGLSWTIAVDPSDLIALAALPLAWHVASHRGGDSPRAWIERLALGLGVGACIASPPPVPSWTTAAFLVNRTGEIAEVRVRWAEARVDCAAIRDRFAEALPRDSFGAGTLFVLAADETLPLDRGLIGASDPWTAMPTPTGHLGTCDIAMISADGMPEAVAFWDGLAVQVIPEMDTERTATGGLALVASDGRLRLDAAPGYQLAAPIDVWEEDGACRDYGAITGFDWSELGPMVDRHVRLREVREGIDGCMSIVLEHDGGLEQRAFVCVPAEDFPFASGDEVRMSSDAEQLRIVRELPLDDGSFWRVAELVVHRGAGPFREGPFDVSVVEVDAGCEGVRMDCGGFRVPGAGGLVLRDGTRFVHPGSAVEREAADGRRARLRVGRAETMWVTHDACGAGRDELGHRLEALVVYGEETR